MPGGHRSGILPFRPKSRIGRRGARFVGQMAHQELSVGLVRELFPRKELFEGIVHELDCIGTIASGGGRDPEHSASDQEEFKDPPALRLIALIIPPSAFPTCVTASGTGIVDLPARTK